MLLILVVWTYIFVTSYLWGASLVRWAFPGALCDQDQPTLLSLVGLSMITVAAGLFSTFSGVGPLFHLLLLSVCLLLLVRDRTLLRPLRVHVRDMRHIAPALLALIAFLFLVTLYKASGPITNPDSGAYHLPFIHWVESFRAIPGVANVHSRFGFNYQYLVLCAVYGFAFLYGETIHALNGYIFFAFLYLMLQPLSPDQPAAQVLSLARLLIALLVANMAFAVTSFSPDFPAAALAILAFLLFVEKVVGDDPLRVDTQTLTIACLSIGAVLFKISAAPALLLNTPGLMGLLWRRPARAMAVATLGGLCLAPFLYRNYVLSGYLVYPLYQLDLFNVDWKVAPEILARDKNLILHGAYGIPLGASWPPPHELPRLWLNTLYTLNRSSLPYARVRRHPRAEPRLDRSARVDANADALDLAVRVSLRGARLLDPEWPRAPVRHQLPLAVHGPGRRAARPDDPPASIGADPAGAVDFDLCVSSRCSRPAERIQDALRHADADFLRPRAPGPLSGGTHDAVSRRRRSPILQGR